MHKNLNISLPLLKYYALNIQTPHQTWHLDWVLASQHIFDLLQIQGDLSWLEWENHGKPIDFVKVCKINFSNKINNKKTQTKTQNNIKTVFFFFFFFFFFFWSSKTSTALSEWNPSIWLKPSTRSPQKWLGALLAPLVPWAQHAARWTWSRKYSAHCGRMADVDDTCERWHDPKMLQNICLVWNWTVVVCFGDAIILQCLAPSGTIPNFHSLEIYTTIVYYFCIYHILLYTIIYLAGIAHRDNVPMRAACYQMLEISMYNLCAYYVDVNRNVTQNPRTRRYQQGTWDKEWYGEICD